MGETLEALHRLQVIELKLAVIRRTVESKTRRVDVHLRNVKRAEDRLQEHHRLLRDLQRKLDLLTLDVTAREDVVSKHRDALNKAKTNKEYAAILTTMNTEKADNSKLELEIIKLMDEVQAGKDGGAKIEAERDKLLADQRAAESALRDYERESQAERERLQASRAKCARDVVPGALAVFTRVAEHHDGEALAPIIKLYPKREEYACSGCNMKVTLEILNSLQTRDDIQVCHVCGRILCLESPPAERTRASS